MSNFLTGFLNAMNVQKLVQGADTSDNLDLLQHDNTPNIIANNRLDTIRRNANNDFFEEMADEANAADKKTRATMRAARAIASDRLALLRTIDYIHDQVKAGRGIEKVMQEIQRFRSENFDQICSNRHLQNNLEGQIKEISRAPGMSDVSIGAAKTDLVDLAWNRLDRTGYVSRKGRAIDR